MDHSAFLAAPSVGSIFCRDDGKLGRHEVAVVAVNVRMDDWVAHVFSDEGILELSKADFLNPRNHEQWRPKAWRWDPNRFCFCPPTVEWDLEKEQWVDCEASEEEKEETLPPASALPKPADGEHHARWRSRCRRKFPALNSDEGALMLGEYWNEFKSQG
jgi:hypothetical protein